MAQIETRDNMEKKYPFMWGWQVRSPLPGRKYLSCLICFLCFTAGCSGVRTEVREIYSDRKVKVHLVSEKEVSGETISKGYQHPWKVDSQTLDRALRFIKYQKKGLFSKDKLKKVFPAPDRKKLLAPLQEAFSKASPDQLIDWSCIYKKNWTIFKKNYLTDGVLFRQGGKLHIVFRNIALEELPGGEYDSFQGNPMKKPFSTPWLLITGKGQSLVKGEGKEDFFGPKEFTNWIALDLSDKADTEGIAVDQAPVGIDEKTMAVKEPKAAVDPSVPLPLSRLEVEKRLQFLEELYHEGVLSPLAYEEKKKMLQQHYKTLPDLEGK